MILNELTLYIIKYIYVGDCMKYFNIQIVEYYIYMYIHTRSRTRVQASSAPLKYALK